MQNTFKCNAVAVSLNQLCKDKRCRKPTGIWHKIEGYSLHEMWLDDNDQCAQEFNVGCQI